jgi:hemophore-related protein
MTIRSEERSIMNIINFSVRRGIAGVGGACLLGAGLAAATIAAPTASAAPDGCSADVVAATVSSVTGSAQQYLSSHPGANQVVTAAYGQPRPQAAENVRGYFTANPQEYYELRGILAPLGDKQRQCNVQVLPPELASAYDQFMAG